MGCGLQILFKEIKEGIAIDVMMELENGLARPGAQAWE